MYRDRYHYTSSRRRYYASPTRSLQNFASGFLLLVVTIVALIVTFLLLVSVYYVRQYLPTVSVIFWGVLVTIAILSAFLGFVCLVALVLSFCSKHFAFTTSHWLDIRERRWNLNRSKLRRASQ